MAITTTPIVVGAGIDAPNADPLFTAFGKVNANFATVEAAAAGVEAIILTASGTAALPHAGTVVEMNVATANTYTIPTHASVAFPVGTVIEVCQVGAGATTIAPAGGVTLRGASTFVLRAQWTSATLRKRATNEWVVVGDFA